MEKPALVLGWTHVGQETVLVTADLDMTTHLLPEGQWALPLAGNSLPLFSSIFPSSPALSWVSWPLWFTWGRLTPSLELL